jgi:hypothetical protein
MTTMTTYHTTSIHIIIIIIIIIIHTSTIAIADADHYCRLSFALKQISREG